MTRCFSPTAILIRKSRLHLVFFAYWRADAHGLWPYSLICVGILIFKITWQTLQWTLNVQRRHEWSRSVKLWLVISATCWQSPRLVSVQPKWPRGKAFLSRVESIQAKPMQGRKTIWRHNISDTARVNGESCVRRAPHLCAGFFCDIFRSHEIV